MKKVVPAGSNSDDGWQNWPAAEGEQTISADSKILGTPQLESSNTISPSSQSLVPLARQEAAGALSERYRDPRESLEQEGYILAKRWREHGDPDAAHKLVTSHLRLVAKIAMGYRGYGLPISEVISEGNVRLMQAVKRFEPEKGFRLATYAMWWMKAAVQEYILRSWSLLKMSTRAYRMKARPSPMPLSVAQLVRGWTP